MKIIFVLLVPLAEKFKGRVYNCLSVHLHKCCYSLLKYPKTGFSLILVDILGHLSHALPRRVPATESQQHRHVAYEILKNVIFILKSKFRKANFISCSEHEQHISQLSNLLYYKIAC